MIVLAFPADEAARIIEGVQTVATYPGPIKDEHEYVERWPLAELVGQTVAVARLPDRQMYAGMKALPKVDGAIVGSVTVAACVPFSRERVEAVVREVDRNHPTAVGKDSRNLSPSDYEGMSDGEIEHFKRTLCESVDFTPGRWALIFTDPAPLTERCPKCHGAVADVWLDGDIRGSLCDECTAVWHGPIPYTIDGPIGEWTP